MRRTNTAFRKSNILSNPIMGYYTFLYKKQADSSVSGYKWTVVFQPEESEINHP